MEANNSRTAVSVIVPIYQSENYLRECLDSLVSQDFDLPYEIILSVFGSSDESLAICEEYEQKYPEKIFIVLGEKNYGISASRNAGIVKSRGDYLTFVDSDDALARNFLSVLYKLAKKGDYDIVTSGFYMYGSGEGLQHPSGIVQRRWREAFEEVLLLTAALLSGLLLGKAL
jgi:glycosyltransferase involved in cell wall biosynthesis